MFCELADKWNFRCGEKLAHLYNGYRRRNFAVEFVSNYAYKKFKDFRFFCFVNIVLFCGLYILKYFLY